MDINGFLFFKNNRLTWIKKSFTLSFKFAMIIDYMDNILVKKIH